ncbi:hypothetical protein [Actinopolymorpha sp. B11F2]|uniref:hypothetical protein n=1 Tax=Actinopolymorpha sp. B11F2 TaxID=3160862 RepID=UPI0032E4E7D9
MTALHVYDTPITERLPYTTLLDATVLLRLLYALPCVEHTSSATVIAVVVVLAVERLVR